MVIVWIRYQTAEWMSLMEKRIETIIPGWVFGFEQPPEWMSLMEKRIETYCTIRHCSPPGSLEWMSLMEKRIETNLFQPQSSLGNQNEWALWKKGLRQGRLRPWIMSEMWVGMNEPYGKKDWDPFNPVISIMVSSNEWALWKKGLRPIGTSRSTAAHNLEWMSLMEKRIETYQCFCPVLKKCLVNEWALWKKGLRLWLFKVRIVSVLFRNEWALWKKGLRLVYQPGQGDTASRMNEPYGKKDWDPYYLTFFVFAGWRMNEPYGKKDWDVLSLMQM